MKVDSFDGKRPSIKNSYLDQLCIGGMIEDVFYKIIEIDYDKFGSYTRNKEVPKIGESICIRYEFKNNDSIGNGYEFLSLFIGRCNGKSINNYVRYFNNIEELEKSILGLKLEIDQDFALFRIKKLNLEISKYKKDYQIED